MGLRGTSRRGLLQGALAALGWAVSRPALASWSPEEQRGVFAVQWNSAYREGTPLLILLIPQRELLDRGQVLGEWLMGLSDAHLAELARVSLVCADAALVRGQIPGLELGPEVFFVVAWPGTSRPAQALRCAVPMRPTSFAAWGTPEWGSEAHQAWNAARLAAEAQAIDGVLWPALVDRPVDPGARKELAGQAWDAWIQNAPPGAHWANSGSCGVRVEAVELRRTISCGMGHVDALSTRLLYFVDISEQVVP